ncbi:hypothetical protein FACS189487_02680 [Campylobacterota bacterium]|nr:hypothetical protein FACS189487_02680 [Campylobacterota bacterium]
MKPAEGNIAAALNSIKQIAQHNENPERAVAISQNNIALVFSGREVWTAIKFDNEKKALEYLRRCTIQSTEKVIKWKQNKQQDEKWSFMSAVSTLLRSAAKKLRIYTA